VRGHVLSLVASLTMKGIALPDYIIQIMVVTIPQLDIPPEKSLKRRNYNHLCGIEGEE